MTAEGEQDVQYSAAAVAVGILSPQYIAVIHEPPQVTGFADGKQKQAPNMLQPLDPPPNWAIPAVGGPP